MSTVVFAARRILTMNPARPEGTHVAVRDGRILAVGTLDEMRAWGDFELDDRFRDRVLMPGFVEGHGHASEGTYWRFTYCGWFDRSDPDGRTWPGLRSVDAVIARLRETSAGIADPTTPLFGWGLDPLFFGSRRMTRRDLDAVSPTRPIAIIHASGHIVNANTPALALAGLMRTGVDHPGIPLDEEGLPAGELRGPDCFAPLIAKFGADKNAVAANEAGFRAYARIAVRAGVTTSTDLATSLPPHALEGALRVTGADDFPLRLVPALRDTGLRPEALVDYARDCRERSTDRLRLGAIKVVADGSIQGFTARLRPPGYVNGAPNGLWYVSPEYLRAIYDGALRAGLQVHTHTNGDQAIELAIDTMAQALRANPVADHRFVLQHCQLADRAQLRRMKALGLCANFFANHHSHWGDAHYASTVGPDRAERMNPCRSAQEIGVAWTIHSDAPVTALRPLHVAWSAVNRLTPGGRVLGDHERIGVAEALNAITLGAAYSLRLDDEIGSIECGKRADFAVLEDDPLRVDPTVLKDVPVWGTVQGGRVFPAASI